MDIILDVRRAHARAAKFGPRCRSHAPGSYSCAEVRRLTPKSRSSSPICRDEESRRRSRLRSYACAPGRLGRRAALWSGASGLRLSLSGARFRLRFAGREADDALHGRGARQAQRRDGGAAAWQEFLRRDLGAPDRRSDPGRLSRRRAGPDRLLQVEQADPLSVQLPAACAQHSRAAAIARRRPRHRSRPFHGRDAGGALCADVSRRDARRWRSSIRSAWKTGRRSARLRRRSNNGASARPG